jgi:hypothetical protein
MLNMFLLLILTFFLRKFYAKEQEYLEVNQRAGPKLCIPGIGAKRSLVTPALSTSDLFEPIDLSLPCDPSELSEHTDLSVPF